MAVVSLQERLDREDAVGPGAIVDQDRPPPTLSELFGEHAGCRVDGAAGRTCYNYADIPVRPTRYDCGHARDGSSDDQKNHQEAIADWFHCSSPSSVLDCSTVTFHVTSI